MDLRTKLVFSLVAVALGSMAALGALAYGNAQELLTTRTLRQLSSLAEAKKEDVESVVDGWQDRVSLIASRTQLRLSLQAFNASGNEAERARIERILDDAQRASSTVHAVAVFDEEGSLVAWAHEDEDDAPWVEELRDPDDVVVDSVAFGGLSFTHADEPIVRFTGPLALDGERIGFLVAWLTTRDLLDVTGDFTGLDETGEAMIVVHDIGGGLRILNPVRHPVEGEVASPEGADPNELALAGEEGPFDSGLVDYRGESVWAATRFLPQVGWGLVVKFDANEERASILEFRSRLVGVGFSLSAFAILLGTFLGFRIAQPIHELAGVANRIRLGELGARAEVDSEDELGLLASTLNEMGDELERRMARLQEYRRFFKVSRDMLCIAGTDGYFKRLNPAFERVLGWSSEELRGRPFVDFIHEDDVKKTKQELERLGRGIPTINFENRFHCADGSCKRLSWTCHPEPESGFLYAIAREVDAEEA